jgi:hypothetical protein
MSLRCKDRHSPAVYNYRSRPYVHARCKFPAVKPAVRLNCLSSHSRVTTDAGQSGHSSSYTNDTALVPSYVHNRCNFLPVQLKSPKKNSCVSPDAIPGRSSSPTNDPVSVPYILQTGPSLPSAFKLWNQVQLFRRRNFR